MFHLYIQLCHVKIIFKYAKKHKGFPGGSEGKESAVWETWVQSLGCGYLLEEGMATHFDILAWRVPMDRGAWWATILGSQRDGHN